MFWINTIRVSEMKTLQYDCMTAGLNFHINKNPCEVIKEIGITYKHCVPQSMFDSFEFWGCENVPANLPKYIKVVNWNPMKRIGNGLSKEKAEELFIIYKDKHNKGE